MSSCVGSAVDRLCRGLLVAQSDGPFAFANGLGATFRVETFNITQPCSLASYFIQGSQRWQSIRLIKGSALTISRAGFASSVSQQHVSAIRMTFMCTVLICSSLIRSRVTLQAATPHTLISGIWVRGRSNLSATLLVLSPRLGISPPTEHLFEDKSLQVPLASSTCPITP